MIDVLIIAHNGVARVYLADVSWLSELASLRAIIAHPIAISAVCDGLGVAQRSSIKWWHESRKDGKT